jgi:hypothetical protein
MKKIDMTRIAKRKPYRTKRSRNQHNTEYETITEIIKTKDGPEKIQVIRPMRGDESDGK